MVASIREVTEFVAKKTGFLVMTYPKMRQSLAVGMTVRKEVDSEIVPCLVCKEQYKIIPNAIH